MKVVTKQVKELSNFIGGRWRSSLSEDWQDVINPATGELLARVPLSPSSEVDEAAAAAVVAQEQWRHVPAVERVDYLFRLRRLLVEDLDQIARQITMENGKTLGEASGEMRRAIENIELACAMPKLMQGTFSEDIAPGIDELMIRQPVGVAAIIAPFNFPGMIPFWFLPYAIAAGNALIVKPSERCPLTMQYIMELIKEAGFPRGLINLVNGGSETANAILNNPDIKAVSFVGSTQVARHVYGQAAANGKRVQAQGGAKNPLVIMPDADLDATIEIIADSAFGNAGQRCLAASLAILVGGGSQDFKEALVDEAKRRVIGDGLVEGVQMGPVITPESKARIERLIQIGLDEGATLLVDGRCGEVAGYEAGNFLRPTILDGVAAESTMAKTEIFGPVLGLVDADTLEDAIELVNRGAYGNMACIFTKSGASARKFRSLVEAGNVGINIGVAAPMAFFPFSGWKDSFFGTLHGQDSHAVEFYTQTKVVVERWPKEWSRRF